VAICTLTILDDSTAEYQDDILNLKLVPGPLGGDKLERETIAVLGALVGDFDCKRPVLRLLGRYLYKVAFGGAEDGEERPLGAAFEAAHSVHKRTQAGGPPLTLRLAIHDNAHELGQYPWEFLCMPGQERDVFLAEEDSQLILTRHVPGTEIQDRALPSEEEKLKILIVLSQPGGPGRQTVSADELIQRVSDLDSDRVAVIECDEPATKENVRAVIAREGPHIVHFIGHGRPGAIAFVKTPAEVKAERASLDANRAPGEPEAIVDEADWADSVSVRECLLAGLDPKERTGRIVFLHACHGASGTAPADSLIGFSNVARALAYHDNVAAVVAMQYPITNGDAQTFATKFYESIQAGAPVDEAVTQARRELGVRVTGGKQSWNDRGFGTPVIYVRSSGPVFKPIARPEKEARKRRCPHKCGQLVMPGSNKCSNPKCGGAFFECPNEGCTGLVPLVAGGECTSCEFKLPAGAAAPEGATGVPTAELSAAELSTFAHVTAATLPPDTPSPASISDLRVGNGGGGLGLTIQDPGNPPEGDD
jgi:hypothetical protein